MTAFKTNGPTGFTYVWPEVLQLEVARATEQPAPGQTAFEWYRGRALANLAWSFRGLPILTAWLVAAAEMFDGLERASFDMARMQDPAQAEGWWLRRLAKLIRAPYSDQYTDEVNRALVAFWADWLVAGNSWPGMLKVLAHLWGVVQVNEVAHTSVSLTLDAPTDLALAIGSQETLMYSRRTLAAGVNYHQWHWNFTDEPGLYFADETDMPAAGVSAGLSDETAVDQTVYPKLFDNAP